MQLGRSALLLVSTVLNFLALRYLQLDEALAIYFHAVHRRLALRAAARRMGRLAALDRDQRRLSGVLVVARPGFGGMHPAALLSLGSAICYCAST